MDKNKPLMLALMLFFLIASCRQEGTARESAGSIANEKVGKASAKELKAQLNARGYKTFDYVDEATGDTIIMQQYFMVFLKRGPNKSATQAERDSLQSLHLAHLGRMYEEGYADISGPFGDDEDIRGITIYNTPSREMADSLAHLDPMVQSGRLLIEVHPWWAAKGFPLR